LSLIVNHSDFAATNYYIEMEEVELTDDELVLALLSESAQNVANYEVV
jgi:hypothetical protein